MVIRPRPAITYTTVLVSVITFLRLSLLCLWQMIALLFTGLQSNKREIEKGYSTSLCSWVSSFLYFHTQKKKITRFLNVYKRSKMNCMFFLLNVLNIRQTGTYFYVIIASIDFSSFSFNREISKMWEIEIEHKSIRQSGSYWTCI